MNQNSTDDHEHSNGAYIPRTSKRMREAEAWEKALHSLSAWQRRAIAAKLLLHGQAVPDILSAEAERAKAEVSQ